MLTMLLALIGGLILFWQPLFGIILIAVAVRCHRYERANPDAWVASFFFVGVLGVTLALLGPY